jgi:hypothetical protein
MIWLIIISILISIKDVSTSVSIGANMDYLLYESRSQPYVNLVRQSYGWANVSNPLQLIPNVDPKTGWPTSDFSVILSKNAVDTGGAYLVYAKGNANISILSNYFAYITNKTYDPSTNTLTAVANIPQNTTSVILCFTNTTGPGLQDLAVLQPGYDLASKSNITNLMLTHLSRFSTIRFMQWTNTNHIPEMNWNETTPVSWPQYIAPKHNPWETIPYIANQINKPIDVWINIPFNASDDYILHVARIMLNDLNPSNNIYVEFCNEVWNGAFPQGRANPVLANESVIKYGDPYHFNYDNVSNPAFWAFRRTAYQIKHISDLFKSVFGQENVGPWKRVRPLLAGHYDYPTIIMQGLDYLNTVFGPPSNFIHGIAIASYFGLGNKDKWTNLTTDQIIEAWNTSVLELLPENGWHYKAPLGIHAIYATWYKLPVHGYEGGPDSAGTCGTCSLEAKINATRDTRLTDLCVAYLNGWYRYGFQELNWYGAGATATNRWGSWGLLEDMRQETLIDTTHMFNASSPVAQLPRPSPKLKAIDQVRQSAIEMNFGISIPSLNINATNFMHHYEPYPTPDIRYIPPNSTFYYPFKITQSPIQINVTVYVGGNSSLLEGGINNEQFVQVQTPKTHNRTIFEPAQTMQFYINQTTIPSIVAFRLRNLESGYSIRSFDVVLSK